MRLKGKVAIITGSGSGQGRVAALMFAREGARVVGGEINDKTGIETIEMIKSAGGEAKHVHVDVTKPKDIQDMVKAAIDAYGRLDILYNNAGGIFSDTGSPLGDSPLAPNIKEENWDRILEINLKSVFMCCKYAVPELLKSGKGSIINVSSAAAMVGGYVPDSGKGRAAPAMPLAYGAAKAGVIALSRSIAIAYSANGIRCNVIVPGSIDTPFHKSVDLTDKAVRKVWEDYIPMRRLGTADDVANTALYLASDESSYVTGVVLPVDGGWMAT